LLLPATALAPRHGPAGCAQYAPSTVTAVPSPDCWRRCSGRGGRQSDKRLAQQHAQLLLAPPVGQQEQRRHAADRNPQPGFALPFTPAVHAARAAHQWDENKIVLGRAAPSQTLPPGGDMGKPGFPIPLLEGRALPWAEAWGNQVSPHPAPRAYVHTSRPCGSAAHEQHENRLFLGGLRLPKPCHRVGIWGNQISPYPCVRARLSRGRRRGETWFPPTPLRGLMFTLAGLIGDDVVFGCKRGWYLSIRRRSIFDFRNGGLIVRSFF